MKSAVVFGGAGFIGSHLLASLQRSGEYDQLISGDIAPPRFVVPGVDYRHIDVRESLPADLPSHVDEIYNLAAVHTTPGHPDREYFVTNIQGAANVCAYAQRIGAKRIVFTSSIAVYGPVEEPTVETSPKFPVSAYGESKLAAEAVHRLWQSENPTERKLVVVRPAVIYGYTERGNYSRLAKLLKRNLFVYPARKDTIKACGYVGDLVASFRFALDHPDQNVTYNFAHPQRYTSEAICEAFHEVAGYNMARIVVPLPLMMLGASVFELLNMVGLRNSINRARILKLTKSTNIVPEWLVRESFPFQHDLKSALAVWKLEGKGDFA